MGARPPELLGGFEAAPTLLEEGYLPVETGFTSAGDGSVRIAVRTPMEGVTPDMWDWWFGWHGSDSRRYKLWHPGAHLSAAWSDGPDGGRRGRDRYVGRTSFVEEYIGASLTRAAIQFVRPSVVGLDEEAFADPSRQTAICARIGLSRYPVDVGWLVHQVRRTATGSEMRSRFWLGGPGVRLRSAPRGVPRGVPSMLQRHLKPTARSATELLVHCAQEMHHLATFLPRLHEDLGTT